MFPRAQTNQPQDTTIRPTGTLAEEDRETSTAVARIPDRKKYSNFNVF